MISDTQIRYGSSIPRHGRLRLFFAYQTSSGAIKFSIWISFSIGLLFSLFLNNTATHNTASAIRCNSKKAFCHPQRKHAPFSYNGTSIQAHSCIVCKHYNPMKRILFHQYLSLEIPQIAHSAMPAFPSDRRKALIPSFKSEVCQLTLALFKECAHALFLVMCIVDNAKEICFHLNRIMDIHVISVVDRCLCNRICVAALACDL